MNKMTLRDDSSGQVILLMGITLALTIIAFATIFYSAGMAGQKTISEEKDEISFVFHDVRDTYGRVLREVSTSGEQNPFDGTNRDRLNIHETQIEHLVNLRGYFLVFGYLDYNSSSRTANVTVRLSDGTTVYDDTIRYNLITGDVG